MGRNSKRHQLVRALSCILLACFCVLLVRGRSAYCQVDAGAITGTVQDPSGAVVPNADVTLLNTDQGITLDTKTNPLADTVTV